MGGAAKIFQVDAFTDRPFHGNPAAVCLLQGPAPASWMQSLAQEMNLSETAFVWPEGDGFHLRWFTPAVEVKLCGHATLATAHVLWETGLLRADRAVLFQTKSGPLFAQLRGEEIEMDFPSHPVTSSQLPAGLPSHLGCEVLFVGKAGEDLLVELGSEEVLRNLSLDMDLLRQTQVRGWIFTCASISADFDFISRFFAPAVGVDEDPVTGSAHCALAPYWSTKLGKPSLQGYQASSRGGSVRVKTMGERVLLAGKAKTVFQGELRFPQPDEFPYHDSPRGPS